MLVVEYKNVKIASLAIDRVILRETGLTNLYTYTAGEILGGHKFVYLKDGKAFLASNTNIECFNTVIGITSHAANINADVAIVKHGTITLTGWGLVPNDKYYLSVDGTITNTVPTTGFYQLVGIALNENTLELNINLPIIRI